MFNNYKKQPREQNWDDIEAKLQEEKLHENLRSKFDQFTAVPSAMNWDIMNKK